MAVAYGALPEGAEVRTSTLLAAGAAALALVVAGCGGDDKSSSGPTTLSVQLLPVGDVAPVYLGVKKGFFADENLKLSIHQSEGGAEVIPLVTSGSARIGSSNIPSLLIAASKGLPIQIVAPGGRGPRKGGTGDVVAIMVRKNSPIRSPKDLEGKSIAVNNVKSISDVLTSAALAKHGVDPSKVKYLEVPIPAMLGALEQGHVDAAYVPSPFKTQGERSGAYRSVMFPMSDTRPGLIGAAYFAAKDWASKNPDVLRRFRSALRKSDDYAAAHPAENRQVLTEFTKIPKRLIPVRPLGDPKPDCQELAASAELLTTLMLRYHALDKRPDLKELIRPGFCAS
jgi:NitT/TauT family transport system substrate-binding protein